MRLLFSFLYSLLCLTSFPQTTTDIFKKDSLMVIKNNPLKGFYHDYVLFIPKGTPQHKQITLLVEPNNTGKITDSMNLHKKYAIDLASVSSVGNNVATNLKIPL